MATKTWKIGERSNPPIIKVIVKKTSITVEGYDYDVNATNKMGGLLETKVFRLPFNERESLFSDNNALGEVRTLLESWANYGIADDIAQWIELHLRKE